MKHFFLLTQNTAIEEKIKNAPDSSYEIGVFIGTFLPFVVLAGIAYWMYYRARKKENNQ
ncbi:hypothetical protein FEDK69T_11260 [Flavobacterium enshiense DK69]|uniref:hypothetical protein n=1 Tax=Flavobacterium enshiense TaxID=1341165 RepID=UPI0003C5A7DB|nr:hypothetical protein [Flavobacterium enshiense]ESU23721.1 hypothetical protein FEDK69T_11260 [Flavobacterium enshiense DK69]